MADTFSDRSIQWPPRSGVSKKPWNEVPTATVSPCGERATQVSWSLGRRGSFTSSRVQPAPSSADRYTASVVVMATRRSSVGSTVSELIRGGWDAVKGKTSRRGSPAVRSSQVPPSSVDESTPSV